MALLELDKLRRDINILFAQVRCLMNKTDENCPLVATEWSGNHSIATGNAYVTGTYVFYNGHVYKCKADNDGLPTSNTTYWLDLGEGHPLVEEQSNWDATGGRQFILNKPTNTSDFTNDGEDGSSPYATMVDVGAAIPAAQDLDSVLGEGDTAPTKNANIKELGLYDDFNEPIIPVGFAIIGADKSRITFKSKFGNFMAWFTEGSISLIKGAYTFTLSLPTMSSNRIATFQNASGIVAYLADIPGQYTLVEYADNAAAITAGLPIGRLYRTGDIVKVVN